LGLCVCGWFVGTPLTGPAGAWAVPTAPLRTCWRDVPSPNGNDTLVNYLEDVDGVTTSDVWSVGYDEANGLQNEGLVEHWDGLAWTVNTKILIGSGDTELFDVRALASDDAWAVGISNTVNPLALHWDGTGWFISSTPIPGLVNTLFGVSAVSSTDIWAVGQYE